MTTGRYVRLRVPELWMRPPLPLQGAPLPCPAPAAWITVDQGNQGMPFLQGDILTLLSPNGYILSLM